MTSFNSQTCWILGEQIIKCCLQSIFRNCQSFMASLMGAAWNTCPQSYQPVYSTFHHSSHTAYFNLLLQHSVMYISFEICALLGEYTAFTGFWNIGKDLLYMLCNILEEHRSHLLCSVAWHHTLLLFGSMQDSLIQVFIVETYIRKKLNKKCCREFRLCFPALSCPLKWSICDSWRRPFTTSALTCGKICVLHVAM